MKQFALELPELGIITVLSISFQKDQDNHKSVAGMHIV